MKNDRNGKAAVLTRAQMDELFSVLPPKYRLLFGICRFTGCRIREALQLQRSDIGQDSILFRRATTKTKMTREVPIAPELAQLLAEAQLPQSGYVFPGKLKGHLTSQAADLMLRAACDYVGFKGEVRTVFVAQL